MKKIIFYILLVASLNAKATNIQKSKINQSSYNDTTVIVQIMALPLNSYIGKPVDSIFSVLPLNYTRRNFMPVGIGGARGVFQSYGTVANNCVTVQVFVDNWQYVSFPKQTKTSSWSMTSAKQETVAYIRILKNNACIYGCGDPNYYY